MFFDALTMACIADELEDNILGGRVQQVLLPEPLSVGLEIYARHQRQYLLASAHADLGRLLLSSEKLRRGIDKETGMLLLMRKYVRGSVLSAIRRPPFERILNLAFDHPEWGSITLVVEVMGRYSNVILVGAGGRVLDAVKHVGPQLSPARPILPGHPYELPPAPEKLSPADVTEYRLRQILAGADDDTQVWRALVQGLLGISPLLAREITFRALGHPRAIVAQVERITPLLNALREILAPLETKEWQPSLAMERGEPVAYAPYTITHRGTPEAVPSMSEAIERYTIAAASADPYAAAKRPVREAIARARTRLERRQAALERSLQAADEADRWRMWGEWILAYAHTIEPGQTELVADTGEGETLHIALDPNLSAADNAQAYFTRYRKGQRAAKGGPARLHKVSLALDDLEQLDTDLDLAENRPAIDEVRAALMEAGYVRTRRSKSGRVARSQPLALTSPDGMAILAGRNSRQNDEVTFRRAGSDDWWFHARGVPGAHVIVRSGGQPLPEDTVRRAAELAGFFSRLRGEADVLVDYTQRRHVRRIPGAAPGLVTYSHEQTIRVAPRGPE